MDYASAVRIVSLLIPHIRAHYTNPPESLVAEVASHLLRELPLLPPEINSAEWASDEINWLLDPGCAFCEKCFEPALFNDVGDPCEQCLDARVIRLAARVDGGDQ